MKIKILIHTNNMIRFKESNMSKLLKKTIE